MKRRMVRASSGRMEPLRRIELHISYLCVNSCVFCSERDHMKEFAEHPASMDEIADILRRKAKAGFDHVTFTGGEPTLYPRIWDVLALAKDLGYRTFLITNGSAFAHRPLVRRVLPLVDELCLSVHGHDRALHDRLTGNRLSYDRMMSAARNVLDEPGDLFVMVNTVVSRRNVRHLGSILKLIGRWPKLRHWLLSHMAPEGDGLRRYSELAVRHGDIARQVPELARRAEERGKVLRVFGVPACALGKHWKHSNDLYFSPRVTIGRVRSPRGKIGWFEEPGILPVREREYLPECRRCALHKRCGGVFRRYRAEFPREKVKPIRGEIELEAPA